MTPAWNCGSPIATFVIMAPQSGPELFAVLVLKHCEPRALRQTASPLTSVGRVEREWEHTAPVHGLKAGSLSYKGGQSGAAALGNGFGHLLGGTPGLGQLLPTTQPQTPNSQCSDQGCTASWPVLPGALSTRWWSANPPVDARAGFRSHPLGGPWLATLEHPTKPWVGGNSSGTDAKPGDLFLGAQRGSSLRHSFI